LKTKSNGILSITGVKFNLLIPTVMSEDRIKRVIHGWHRFEMLSSIQFNVQSSTSLLKVIVNKLFTNITVQKNDFISKA